MFSSREINLENPARAPGYNWPQIRNDRNSHENPTIDNYWSQTPYIPDYIYPNVNLPAVTTTGRSNPDSFKPFIKVPVFNYANPAYGVATICHQVRWLRWGHPSLFHTATSLLIWYKMFCVRDISHRLIWMEFINMLSVHAQTGTHSRFNW